MIKAVIFDFVQTLGDAAEGYKDAEKNSQEKLYKKLGIDTWDKYKDLYREERKQHFDRRDFSRKNVWIKMCEHFNVPADNDFLNQLENEYWEFVKNSMKLFPEALDVIKKLKEKYKLGMVSNSQKDGSTKALQNDEYKKLEKLFDVIVIAGEGDIPAKPDPAPFKLALEKLGVNPDEAIFVGDDFKGDIDGSKKVGLTPIWLKHYSVKRNWPEAEFKVDEITNLEQVLDIVKKL
ncbi:MAG: HAD family hydrolase [Spirochaetaceae bacterium]|nr:HAD family hydrolase [Spirochaetaceae bacterium]